MLILNGLNCFFQAFTSSTSKAPSTVNSNCVSSASPSTITFMKSRVPRKIITQSNADLSITGLGGERETYSMEFMAGRDDRIKFPSRKNVVVEGISNTLGGTSQMVGTAAAVISGQAQNLWPQPILQVC